MKTIKTSLTQTGGNLYIKALIVGTIFGGISAVLLLCLFTAMLLLSGTLPINLLQWFGVATGCIASLISGYTCARITKANGMIVGFCGGLIIFIIFFIAGAIKSDALTLLSLIKLALYTLCGAIGGIKGVNKKEKLHIK